MPFENILQYIALLGAASAGIYGVWRYVLGPIFRGVRIFWAKLNVALDAAPHLLILAQNQERILRLLDENGGGWRQKAMHRIEKLELITAQTKKVVQETKEAVETHLSR